MNVSGGVAGALEMVRPWLSTAFIGSILALMVKLFLDNRKLRLAEKSRDQDFQLEVSADGRTNLQFVIDNLVRDIASQRDATAAANALHASCQEELSKLRDANHSQGTKLDGLSRQFLQFADSVGRAIPPGNWSPEVTDMMRQLKDLGRAASDQT